MPTKTYKDPIEKILEAAKKCYLRDGISKTGMKEVSQDAQVARSTLYRYFASKDEVLIAVIKSEMEVANEAIISQLTHISTPADMMVESLLIAFKEVPKRPLLKTVFASDDDPKARRVIWESNIIIELGDHLLEQFIKPAMTLGVLRNEVKPEVMAEWIFRILLSFLTLPSNWIKSDDEMRATLRALLVPVLLR